MERSQLDAYPLARTAKTLIVREGQLAMDEGNPTCKKRVAVIRRTLRPRNWSIIIARFGNSAARRGD